MEYVCSFPSYLEANFFTHNQRTQNSVGTRKKMFCLLIKILSELRLHNVEL